MISYLYWMTFFTVLHPQTSAIIRMSVMNLQNSEI